MEVKPLKLPDSYNTDNYQDNNTLAGFNNILKSVYVKPIRDEFYKSNHLFSLNPNK